MVTLWTILGIALVTLFVKYLFKKKYKLPPGPWGLPFFGNVFQMDKDCPHGTLTKWSEEYGDVFLMKAFGRKTVVLNSYEAIHAALITKANNFAGRTNSYRIQVVLGGVNNVTFDTFSPKWVSMKKTTMQTLKMYGDTLENLEVITLDLIDDMLKELMSSAREGAFDVYPIVHRCTTGIVSSILFGYKIDDQGVKTLLKAIDESGEFLQPTGPRVLLDIAPWMRHFLRKMYRQLVDVGRYTRLWIDEEIEKRKLVHEPGNSKCFVDGLLDHQLKNQNMQNEHRLSDDDIFGMTNELIFAGTITTSVTVYCLIAILVNKPEVQKKMADEIFEKIGSRTPRLSDRKILVYIEAAILEVLRYSSILPVILPHCTTVDTSISGYEIPKDTQVLFNVWKLHHNPEYWDEPWEFRPERFLDEDGNVVRADHINRKRLLAFGASRRVCVGETLAKNRLFLMVTSLIQHFEFLPAGPDQLPRHDPRDFEVRLNIQPHKFPVKIIQRV